MKATFIIGHKKPDTDSVCSAIALAYLKNTLGMNAIPRILGPINNETKFVLNYFHVKEPMYLNDVKLQIKDIDYGKNLVCEKQESLYDAVMYMQQYHLSSIPIVNHKRKFLGLLSMKDITKELISWDYDILKTSYDNILKTLHAEEILRFDEEITGNVLVASFKSTTFIQDIALDNSSILIVGDRHSIIEYAVESGVKLLIITGNNEIKEKHLEIAKKNHVNIVKTPLRTFNIVKVIGLCNYAETLMYKDNIVAIQEKDYVKDFIELSNRLRYKVFPVLNPIKECLGVVQIADTINKHRKKVILVDHNEIDQSVDGLEEAEIVEIVDHHKIGTIGTSLPINFRNMTLGCTCSIVYLLFQENKVKIPKEIAGIMLAAIISDTLLFRSPTTTELDKEIAQKLSSIAGVKIEKFGYEMFRNGSSLKGKSMEDILYTDFKDFSLENNKIGISQFNTLNIEELEELKNDFVKTLAKIKEAQGYQMLLLFATDIIKEGSYIYYTEESKEILEKAFDIENLSQGYFLPSIVSRKKQIIPALVEVYEEK